MASRTYDIELECGCLLSADGGGGCIPCGAGYYQYDPTYTPTQTDYDLEAKCSAAWAKFRESGEMDQYNLECERRNS